MHMMNTIPRHGLAGRSLPPPPPPYPSLLPTVPPAPAPLSLRPCVHVNALHAVPLGCTSSHQGEARGQGADHLAGGRRGRGVCRHRRHIHAVPREGGRCVDGSARPVATDWARQIDHRRAQVFRCEKPPKLPNTNGPPSPYVSIRLKNTRNGKFFKDKTKVERAPVYRTTRQSGPSSGGLGQKIVFEIKGDLRRCCEVRDAIHGPGTGLRLAHCELTATPGACRRSRGWYHGTGRSRSGRCPRKPPPGPPC